MKADFGLDSFVLRDFWATEAALGVTMRIMVNVTDQNGDGDRKS